MPLTSTAIKKQTATPGPAPASRQAAKPGEIYSPELDTLKRSGYLWATPTLILHFAGIAAVLYLAAGWSYDLALWLIHKL